MVQHYQEHISAAELCTTLQCLYAPSTTHKIFVAANYFRAIVCRVVLL